MIGDDFIMMHVVGKRERKYNNESINKTGAQLDGGGWTCDNNGNKLIFFKRLCVLLIIMLIGSISLVCSTEIIRYQNSIECVAQIQPCLCHRTG